jgi:hypothetical protein
MKSCLDSWSVVRYFLAGVVVCEEVLDRMWTAVRSSLLGAVLLSGGYLTGVVLLSGVTWQEMYCCQGVTWQEPYCCQGLSGRRCTAVRGLPDRSYCRETLCEKFPGMRYMHLAGAGLL